MVHCTRPGCGVDFEPGTPSQQGTCVWHPGAPVFHEGSKSWSCCKDFNKPVLEFDEFLKIKGCSTEDGHTDVKREKETFKKASNGGVSDADLVSIPAATTLNGNNGASTSSAGQHQSVTPMSSKVLDASRAESTSSKEAAVYIEEEDPAKAQDLASGLQCKRTGCKATHSGGIRDRSEEDCRFHKGVAIFHEGSKGYTCCRRRVLEFDEFLMIEPCTSSSKGHLFVGAAKASQSVHEGEEEAQCRLDHYETPADVRVTVYAKNVEVERSKIEIQDEQVLFSLALPPIASHLPPRRFTKTLLPFSQIDAAASTFKVTKFKIDLVLIKKVKGESWPTLERGEKSYGYGLTFGRNKDA